MAQSEARMPVPGVVPAYKQATLSVDYRNYVFNQGEDDPLCGSSTACEVTVRGLILIALFEPSPLGKRDRQNQDYTYIGFSDTFNANPTHSIECVCFDGIDSAAVIRQNSCRLMPVRVRVNGSG